MQSLENTTQNRIIYGQHLYPALLPATVLPSLPSTEARGIPSIGWAYFTKMLFSDHSAWPWPEDNLSHEAGLPSDSLYPCRQRVKVASLSKDISCLCCSFVPYPEMLLKIRLFVFTNSCTVLNDKVHHPSAVPPSSSLIFVLFLIFPHYAHIANYDFGILVFLGSHFLLARHLLKCDYWPSGCANVWLWKRLSNPVQIGRIV